MKRYFFFLFFLFVFFNFSVASYFTTYPAISPDGEKLAFVYHGDIWISGVNGENPKRLTDNVDYDYRPIWSPDGKEIAFTSNRDGNYEVYVIDANGGTPKRLTFNSSFDGVYDWGVNNRLYIGTNRDPEGDRVYTMLPSGKKFKLLLDYDMLRTKVNRYGDILTYTRSSSAYWEKRYNGSAAGKIIIYYPKTKKIKYLVKDKFINIYPVWGENRDTIYFLSNRTTYMNVWKLNIKTGKKTQITFFKGKDADMLYATPDGRYLSFSVLFTPYIYDTKLKKLKKVNLNLNVDRKISNNHIFKIGHTISEGEISPDGKSLLFVSNGDIIYKNIDKKKKDIYPINLTDSPYWEYDVVWHPNSEIFAYISTEDGNFNIYISDKFGKKRRQITHSKALKDDLSFSPDGKYLAYVENKGLLKIYNLKTKSSKVLIDMPEIYTVKWSPDSSKIAFTKFDENYNDEIYIVSLDGKIKRNVTLHPEDDWSPVWGKKSDILYWISKRFGTYYIMSLNFNSKKEKYVSLLNTPDYLIKANQKRNFSTSDAISEIALLPDGKNLIAKIRTLKQSGIWKIDIEKGKAHFLLSSKSAGGFRINKKLKKIFYVANKRLYSVNFSGRSFKNYSVSVYKHQIRTREYKEIFNEAWTLLRERFYDPNMHGYNWKKIRKLYEPFLDSVLFKADLYSIIKNMLGELKSSHLGIWGNSEYSHNPYIPTGYFGAKLDEKLIVKKVYLYGDAYGKIKVGDKLLKIGDVSVKTLFDVDRALENKVGKKVKFYFKNSGEITLKCTDRYRLHKLYQKEVDTNRALYVSKKTGNRVLYIHLRGMGDADLLHFKEMLGAQSEFKDGLILDVRDNGGGHIANSVLDMLERKIYAYSHRRGMKHESIWPSQYAWTKKIVVLINEQSFSNAEIFPSGIKALKLGKVIGVPTAGWVIGTLNVKLVDGTTFRTPFVKWYTKSRKNMEHLGIKPDIYVENSPEDVLKNRDKQLDKAIEVIMSEIKK